MKLSASAFSLARATSAAFAARMAALLERRCCAIADSAAVRCAGSAEASAEAAARARRPTSCICASSDVMTSSPYRRRG